MSHLRKRERESHSLRATLFTIAVVGLDDRLRFEQHGSPLGHFAARVVRVETRETSSSGRGEIQLGDWQLTGRRTSRGHRVRRGARGEGRGLE